jgi:hypothetical protein
MLPRLCLFGDAREAWRQGLRPWLEASGATGGRSTLVVSTRGQVHAIRRLVVEQRIPLAGVDILTPGLAGRKLLAAAGEVRMAAGREVAAFGLAELIRTIPDAELVRSVRSDPNGYWTALTELLAAGFSPGDFPHPDLSVLAGALETWLAGRGFHFSQRIMQDFALGGRHAPSLGRRLLLWGLGSEHQSEFMTLAALCRVHAEVGVYLPEPRFVGRTEPEEGWADMWSALLGVEPEPIPPGDARPPSMAHRIAGDAVDEATWIVEEALRLHVAGAKSVAVVVPGPGVLHDAVAREFKKKGVEHADFVSRSMPGGSDLAVQRGVVGFQARGCRMDDLVALWPLLKGTGSVRVGRAPVRRALDRLFSDNPVHGLGAHVEIIAGSSQGALKEVSRFLEGVGGIWPSLLSAEEALVRFHSACAGLGLEPAVDLSVFEGFSRRCTDRFETSSILAFLGSFLSEPEGACGGRGFERIVVGTRRRLEGLPWSHVIVGGGHEGGWPEAKETTCWLSDASREELNRRSRFSLGLVTGPEGFRRESASWSRFLGSVTEGVLLTASARDIRDPESPRMANVFLEPLLVRDGETADLAVFALPVFGGGDRPPATRVSGGMVFPSPSGRWV